jgi:fucose 4-O-acetylase-like acetyltransferase
MRTLSKGIFLKDLLKPYLIYWSYSWIQKLIRQDPSVDSSFGEILDFLRPNNDVNLTLT